MNATSKNLEIAARVAQNLGPVSRITEGSLMARLKDYIQWQLVQYPTDKTADEVELKKPETSWCANPEP